MSKDFGWFLISVGIIWLVLVSPIELGFLKNPLSLPIGLIVIGVVSVLNYYVNSEIVSKLNGLLFIIFIILLLRAYSWNMPFVFMHGMVPRTNSYNTSFIPAGVLTVDCDACEVVIDKNNFYADFSVSYPDNVNISSLPNGIKIDNGNNMMSSSLLSMSLPVVVYDVNVNAGSIDGSIDGSGNITINAGSIDLGVAINGDVRVVSNVGSINLAVNEVSGDSLLYIKSDVGSINVNLGSTEYMIEASVNVGSVNNNRGTSKSAGYNSSSDRVRVIVSTDVGSINII
ncbi:MAG TPA: hypothetical protein VI790_05165 [Candidatus Nanoarchaeia archaeon]|nr:hypothetical protein [Candidatus Nanoarchaeia archaeon]